MLENLILGLMLAGSVVLLCGALASFSWRKTGVSVGDSWLAGSKAAAHPERYVRADRVLVVRVLNFVGVSLWLSGVLILTAKTLQPLLR